MSATTFIYLAVGLMFVLPGVLALWVGIMGSSWFFGSNTSKFIAEKIGMRWARVLYCLLGLLLIAAAILVVVDPMDVMKGIKQ